MGCRNETHEVENCREDTQFVNKIMAREKNDITKRVLIAEVLLDDMQKVTIKLRVGS